MSVKVGHIDRHVDVHGVSGEGRVADVFEASNGKCIVIWISPNTSVNVYDSAKAVENVHNHGGKTAVIWDWESPLDPDPMDALQKKDEDRPSLSEDEANAIVEEVAEATSQEVASRVAEKVAEKMATKAAEEKKAPKAEEALPEAKKAPEPEEEKKPRSKSPARRKAPAKKKG